MADKKPFVNYLGELKEINTGDVIPIINGGTGVTSLSALAIAIGQLIYPVGMSIELNVATNPATLLGFGTWAAHGTGRVTVAIDAGQTEFDTLGEIGGAKTHLLTSSESGLPAHNHPLANGGSVISSGSADAGIPASGAYFRVTSIGNNTAANASTAHNNLQPYIVVYRWVRTA